MTPYIAISNSKALIPCWNKKHGIEFFTVDLDRIQEISDLKWYYQVKGGGAYRYAYTVIGKRFVLLHRYLTEAGSSHHVDHRDGDTKNNTIDNLRACTPSENLRNSCGHRGKKSSRFKGVYPHKRKWRARIFVGGKNINIGSFALEEDAARAYNAAASQHFGSYAKLNVVGN